MKSTTKLFLTLALVATTASSAPVSSYALNREASRDEVEHATRVGGPTAQRWWGSLAGTICRFGSGLYNPYSGFCIIALIDVMT